MVYNTRITGFLDSVHRSITRKHNFSETDRFRVSEELYLLVYRIPYAGQPSDFEVNSIL
jgi:hypothetical protein